MCNLFILIILIHLFNLSYLKEDIPIELRRSHGSTMFLLENLNFTSEKSFITGKKPCALDGWPESDSNLSLCKIPDHLAPLLFCTDNIVHNSMTLVVESLVTQPKVGD